jgi:endonuclease/exonuclease/phosphatase family metal-dependent hydrolase
MTIRRGRASPVHGQTVIKAADSGASKASRNRSPRRTGRQGGGDGDCQYRICRDPVVDFSIGARLIQPRARAAHLIQVLRLRQLRSGRAAGNEGVRARAGDGGWVVVRIASVNAWGGSLCDELLAWLPGIRAHIVCLQEVTRTPGLTGWTRFDDGERSLPQRADLLYDVRGVLPRHQAIFVTSDSGPVHDGTGDLHRQDFGLATLVAENLPVYGLDSTFVHGQFVDHGQWTVADRPRIALAVRTADRAAGRSVWVVQVHGLRDPLGKGDTPARRRQAERLAELVRRIRSPRDLVVVCGDFNLLPDSETFGVLAELGLTDLVGAADTRTSHYRKPVRHASYLLVSDLAAVKRFEILAEPEVADHRALILDI